MKIKKRQTSYSEKKPISVIVYFTFTGSSKTSIKKAIETACKGKVRVTGNIASGFVVDFKGTQKNPKPIQSNAFFTSI